MYERAATVPSRGASRWGKSAEPWSHARPYAAGLLLKQNLMGIGGLRTYITGWQTSDGNSIRTFMSTLANQAFLLVLISACLGACIVRAFWEIEQSRERRRQQGRNAVQPTRRR
jgi:hypothetical protein